MGARTTAPVPPKEEIERLAKSLKEDMGYMMKYLHLKRKGVNGFIAVAAFIASIQALIISFTKDSNTTLFERATNIVGLCGIIFDVTGAVLGATYVLVILDSIEEGYSLVMGIHRAISELLGLNLSEEKIRDIEARLSDLDTVRRGRWEYVSDTIVTQNPRPFTTRMFLYMAENISFGVMGLGVACLLVSVVMFSATLGYRCIWIPCLILACVASFIAVAPLETLISRTSVTKGLKKLEMGREINPKEKSMMLLEEPHKSMLLHDEKNMGVEVQWTIGGDFR